MTATVPVIYPVDPPDIKCANNTVVAAHLALRIQASATHQKTAAGQIVAQHMHATGPLQVVHNEFRGIL